MSAIDFPTSEEKQRGVLMALQNGQHLQTLLHGNELKPIKP